MKKNKTVASHIREAQKIKKEIEDLRRKLNYKRRQIRRKGGYDLEPASPTLEPLENKDVYYLTTHLNLEEYKKFYNSYKNFQAKNSIEISQTSFIRSLILKHLK
jgi:hypothetical protein